MSEILKSLQMLQGAHLKVAQEHPELFEPIKYLTGVCYWCEHKIYSTDPMYVKVQDGQELRFCSSECYETAITED